MSRSVLLTTTGAQSPVTIDDLGEVQFVHPTSNLDLVAPNGQFTYEEVINSTETSSVTASLQAAVNAGYITLTDASGNPITDLGSTTLAEATATETGIVGIGTQTFGGRKTFNDDRIIIDPTDAGTSTTFEIGWFNDLTPEDPNSFGMRRTDGGGVFSWMNNASFPQLFLGDPAGTGSAFIDVTNNRPLNLNVLDTGVDDPGTVTVGIGGFVVAGSSGITNVNPMEVNRGTGGGTTLSFVVENDGTLTAGDTTSYEALVLSDNDIPNKRYIDDALSSLDLPAVQARRTTIFGATGTWTDIDFDTTDVENVPLVIDHDDTARDVVTVFVDGLYLLQFDCAVASDIEIRFRVNDTLTVPGGQILTNGGNIEATHLMAIYQATANDFFTVQAQDNNNDIQVGATFKVIKLDGVPGGAGPAGADGSDGADGAIGPQGPTGFGVYAWSDTVGATGVQNDGVGISCVRNGTGSYTYTFDVAVASANYAVNAQYYDLASDTDMNVFVNNRTTLGFDLTIGLGDNGATADVLTDADHTLIVIGPGSGAPSGSNTIGILNDSTPVTGTPFGSINFSDDFTAVDGGSGIVDVGVTFPAAAPFAIIRVPSVVGDLVADYNTTVSEIAMVLTGTALEIGTASTDFTNASGTITCNFTGFVRVTGTVPHTSTGSRASLKAIIQVDTGGGFTNYGGASYSYIRNGGSNTDRDHNYVNEVISVTSGDDIRIGLRRTENNTQGAAINLLAESSITVERLS